MVRMKTEEVEKSGVISVFDLHSQVVLGQFAKHGNDAYGKQGSSKNIALFESTGDVKLLGQVLAIENLDIYSIMECLNQ